MIVTLSSSGGSPGVTSWAMLLAAAWPAEYRMERVVLEADLDGGVLGARCEIGIEPGAATLVSSARRIGEGSLDIESCGRRVSDDAWLVPGPESAEHARPLWSGRNVAASVAAALAADERVWLVDVGRAAPSSSLAPLFEQATMSLVVTRPEHESLVQVPSRVDALRRATGMVGVMVVGKPAFADDELQHFFASNQLWTVENDRSLVDTARQVWSQRRARRSMLWRNAITVAADVADATSYRTPATASSSEVSDAG